MKKPQWMYHYWWSRGITLLLLSLLAISNSFASSTTFTNPIYENGADPWLIYYHGNYYSATTTWSSQLEMRKSPTLAGLADATPVNVWSETDSSRCCNFWAFEFHRLNGPDGWRWYMLYTSGQSGTYDYQHISVLESQGDDPMGPYEYKGSPLEDSYNIDGSYITIKGQLYLMYSQWNGAYQQLYIVKMSDPWTTSGSPSLLSTPSLDWEQVGMNVNEGPEPLIYNGHVYVVYSASYCATSSYKLGLLELTGDDPLSTDSWTKAEDPVFESANGVYAPGHNGFFSSPDGTEDWIVYHANASASDGCGTTRSLRAQSFTWNSDETPNFGEPVATGTAIAVPSGENGPMQVKPQAPTLTLSHYTISTSGTSQLDSSMEVIVDQIGDGVVRLANSEGNFLAGAQCSSTQAFLPWQNADCQKWVFAVDDNGLLSLTNATSNESYAACGGDDCATGWSLSTTGDVAIVSGQSGRVLTSTGSSTEQQAWSGDESQIWQINPQANGTVTLTAGSDADTCLSAGSSSTVFASCTSSTAQWYVRPRDEGGYRFVSAYNSKLLDLTNCALDDGTAVGVYADLDNICQRFYLRDVSTSNVVNTTVSGTYRITPLVSGKAIDITNCGTSDATNVEQWSWLNNDCQKFAISSVDEIWHRISPLNAPNQAVTVKNGYRTSNTNIELSSYDEGWDQQFRFQVAGSGKWRIINRNSELCLQVVDGSSNDGANIVQYKCIAGETAQMFSLVKQN
ncbi:family 43 glycosylhydrolase [Vibrio porteresiae]|uniref:Family 43 glycosylhydrolase n=1 Tax=Vibrio porteresiae DSM 19223 TaxID=1123496 RepID=A0ABZ0QGW1_9VIBR|nr:family 43 glycosylhydrolase [Vibrio porteresiae]WPC75746.1 family 43 glycosylhydrolase [Vibrio porteresiae DSM 19223]